MATPLPLIGDSDEGIYRDVSTAPTTPEGSLTFSPVLQPRTGGPVDDELVGMETKSNIPGISLPSPTVEAQGQSRRVRNICCIGAGYVGGPTAAVIAFKNPELQVTVVDKDESRIKRWNSPHLPIYEPGLENIVRVCRDGLQEAISPDDPVHTISDQIFSAEPRNHCTRDGAPLAVSQIRKPNLAFTTNMEKSVKEADIVFIAVNTPTKHQGSGAGAATDMTALEGVVTMFAKYARAGTIIVEKSTVPCKTAQLIENILGIYRPGVEFEILSNPEFLAAGTAVDDLLDPARVLIGSSPTATGYEAASKLASLYTAWIPKSRIITTNTFSSELAKLVSNSMLAQRISSINTISILCQVTGADVDEVATAVGADPRIGPKFLRAGIGFGGSCFKKDILSLAYLADSLNLPEISAYWRSVVEMNELARNVFASRVIECLNNTLRGKKVAILGYAFKKDTNDTRESPALEIIRSLLEENPQEVAVFDPCCSSTNIEKEIERLLGCHRKVLRQHGGPVTVYTNVYDACYACNAVLVTTDADEFSTSVSVSPSVPGQGGRPPARVALSKGDIAADPTANKDWESVSGPTLSAPRDSALFDQQKPSTMVLPLCLNKPPPSTEQIVGCDWEKAERGAHVIHRLDEHPVNIPIDWARISYHMQMPKWVFDGRGVLNVDKMGELGFRVETVGRQRGCGVKTRLA